MSVMCCIVMSFASQSFISFSNGFTNGEPFIVCALMMWSSRISWMSSIDVSIDTPFHDVHTHSGVNLVQSLGDEKNFAVPPNSDIWGDGEKLTVSWN